jgi:hypothetical protein
VHAYILHSTSNIETGKPGCEIWKLRFEITFECRCQWINFLDIIHGCEEELEGIFLVLIELNAVCSGKRSRGYIQTERCEGIYLQQRQCQWQEIAELNGAYSREVNVTACAHDACNLDC